MKSFVEHAAGQEELEEGIIRTSAIAVLGGQARKYGDDAVSAYRRGQQALHRGGGSTVSVEARIARLEAALDSLFDGLIKQRQQIGSHVALDVAGHTLAAKCKKC